MTPQEFKEKQKVLGWTRMQMAEYLGVSIKTVHCYRTGRSGIPITVAKLLAQENKHNKHDNIKSPKMTPQEFKEKQKALGWDNNQMAEYLGVSIITVSYYRSGRTGIPITVAKLLAQENKNNKHDNIKSPKMTPQKFKEKQKALGWTRMQMAEYLGVSIATVYGYRSGRAGVPIMATKLLAQANKHKKRDNIKSPKMTPQEFKEKQKALGWTNDQMAEYLGVSITTVSCYRTGRTGIPITTTKLLAQANKHNKHDNIKSPKMTPQEFKEKQKALGWTSMQMAEYLGVSIITVVNYRRGRTCAPITVAKLLAQANKHNNIKTTKMTPQEFKEKQEALGLTDNQMAEYLGVSLAIVLSYRSGKTGIPIMATKLLA